MKKIFSFILVVAMALGTLFAFVGCDKITLLGGGLGDSGSGGGDTSGGSDATDDGTGGSDSSGGGLEAGGSGDSSSSEDDGADDHEDSVVYEGLNYEINEDRNSYYVKGVATLSGTELTIASEVDGLPVTAIAAEAFKGNTDITSVTIPASMKLIGESAFRDCTALGTVTFDKDSANAKSLAANLSVAPENIEEIADGTTQIGEYAFAGCSSIHEIHLPASLTKIGHRAFLDCTKLVNVNYAGTINQWCEIEFVAGENDFTANPLWFATRFYTDNNSLGKNFVYGDVVIDSAAEIKDCAFVNYAICLHTVTFGSSVKKIGDWAFAYCENLTTVTFQGSVEEIGEHAFYGTGVKNL